MDPTWQDWMLLGVYTVSIGLTMASVGEVRKPITREVAMFSLFLTMIMLMLVFTGCAPVDAQGPDRVAGFDGCEEPELIVNDIADNFFPARPKGQYNFMVRHMGSDAAAVDNSNDISWVTGWNGPYVYHQRSRINADPNSVSIFQTGCAQVGTFQNSWAWNQYPVSGGGPHTYFEYLFPDPLPPAFVGDKGLMLQAYAEIPWVLTWGDAVGQVGMGINLIDVSTNQAFSVGVNIFDNRWDYYEPFVWHDGGRPFVSSPLVTSDLMTVSPYSAGTTDDPWLGMRFFRIHFDQDNLATVVEDINSYCATRQELTACALPYSTDPADYRVVRFGIAQEVVLPTGSNITMGSHFGWVELYRSEPL